MSSACIPTVIEYQIFCFAALLHSLHQCAAEIAVPAVLLQVILIVGAMQMAMTAYGFNAPNMSKVIGAMLIGIAGAPSRSRF